MDAPIVVELQGSLPMGATVYPGMANAYGAGDSGVGIEHYLIDLIVSVPFALAVQSVFSGWLPLTSGTRWICPTAGLGVTVAWIVLLRFGIRVFEAIPLLSWLLSLLSSAISISALSSARDVRTESVSEHRPIDAAAKELHNVAS